MMMVISTMLNHFGYYPLFIATCWRFLKPAYGKEVGRRDTTIVDTFRAGPRVMVQFLPTETVGPTPLKGDRKVLRPKEGYILSQLG